MHDQTRMKKFGRWLKDRGAEILTTKSDWELIRFRRGHGQTGVLYRNSKNNNISFNNDFAEGAYLAYRDNKPWEHKIKTVNRVKGSKTKAELVNRDGRLCFFCEKHMTNEDMSIEHILEVSDGGSNHMSNMALAHKWCNEEVKSMTIVEKMVVRDQMRRGDYEWSTTARRA